VGILARSGQANPGRLTGTPVFSVTADRFTKGGRPFFIGGFHLRTALH
jgi:hypothetical protein